MRDDQAIHLLRRRVRELDAVTQPFIDPPEHDLLRFITVMASYVNTSMGPRGSTVIAAENADEIVATSALIASISALEPNILTGPLRRNDQHWLPTNRDASSSVDTSPTQTRFIDPRSVADAPPSPHHLRGGGLYTSTPTTRGRGMWELYLETFPSQFAPKPWYIWAVEVGSDPVLEISTAVDWARFVENFGRERAGLVYPDWSRAADEFAGVHVTALAIAAAQGFSLITRLGLTAPAFWDVEQTVWLRWAFGASRLVRIRA